MLPIFFKYILASKAAFFMYISPRFLTICAVEHMCFVQAFLLIGLPKFSRTISFLPPVWSFPSRQQASTKAWFISWKHQFLGVILSELLVHSLRFHSILEVLAKPTEFEQPSITFIWSWLFLHTVNFVISVVKESMEMIMFLSGELGFLTFDVLP